MIKLTTKSWHVRLFYWSERMWKMFADSWNETNSPSTDLCTYIRTMFVLMPLALCINAVFWAAVGYVALYFPFRTFGAQNIGMAAAGLVVLFFGAWLLLFVATHLWRGVRDLAGDVVESLPKKRPAAKTAEPSIFNLFWRYIVDAHNKVCVIVKIGE